ncbi:DUF2799 domain-containing protein [Robiginitomaculum antarcticum]|uniref:DUF2799 domain-containing protein n=1 Tax=Robiginitomaculum antarcticum TaxID=437507 RepID=UPI00037654A0|nr:DUF2799 domain-containing protein [Robiginitomaculum antarcticum]
MNIQTVIMGSTALLLLPACASISESECAAGNWQDLGYRDGLNGVSRSQIAEYSTTCSEYGLDTDSRAYERGYERGLALYCVPEKAYDMGVSGMAYTGICAGTLTGDDFRIAYEDGRVQYQAGVEHTRLQSRMQDFDDKIEDIRVRMRSDEIGEDEYDRLRRKRDRLEDERATALIDMREFERANGLPKAYRDY